MASGRVLAWAVTAIGARMPVAMAPLALVFLARDRPGGYTLGATLAAVYVIGEIVGAPVLGMRLRPDRARPHLTTGLAAGAAAFAGLGAFPAAHPAFLAAFAFLAGAAPAAVPGGLRSLLTGLVPRQAVAQALSVESMLMSGIWAVSPPAVTGLALEVAPRVSLLLAAALMAASIAGLWMVPPGWESGPAGGGGLSVSGLLARAWPVYVTAAASLSLLSLAELVLPALLEQRGAPVGWSGPLLTGLAVGSGIGAFAYGLRSWPGTLRVRSVVLMCGLSVCLALAALIPGTPWIAMALAVGGMLQAGATVTRNLALREVLPAGALAAGYSVMYAAVGAGYAATGSLAGALLRFAAPSTAILAGIALALTLTAVGAWGEGARHRASAPACGEGAAVPSVDAAAADAVPVRGTGAERPPVGGGRDPERRL